MCGHDYPDPIDTPDDDQPDGKRVVCWHCGGDGYTYETDDDEKAKTALPDDDESPDKRIICGRCIGIGYYYGGFACGACLGAGYTYETTETEEDENED